MNESLIVAVRGLIAFFTLLIYTRILGKQQVTQLTFFDYILGITIGSIASAMTVDMDSRAWPHFVGLTVWFVLSLLLHFITLKSRKISDYLEGKPTVIIDRGKILNDAMKKNRLTLSDLLGLLREQGIFDLLEIECAVLESDGKLSILKKSEYQPLTPSDMQIKTKYKGLNTVLIYDGEILEQNLKDIGQEKPWLINKLKKQGIQNETDCFLATINSAGDLYTDKYDNELAIKGHDTFSNKKKDDKK